MNLQHFRAFLWLRWRLLVNQWRRSGRLNAALMIGFTVAAVATAVPLFAGGVWLGLYAIPRANPVLLMAAWDGLILVFLFFWSVGLLSELQRSEPLVLSKFMHLPVSPTGAFLINFLSSLLSLSLIIFSPIMLAFGVALVATKGPIMIPSLAGLAAFLFMITALNYQFRGWLASLMSNPRRKRTVIAAATGFFILVTQLPNLINLYSPWANRRAAQDAGILELSKLVQRLQSRQIDVQGFEAEKRKIEAAQRARFQEEARQTAERWTRVGRWVNMALPVGWLPWGVMSAAEGDVLPSLLGLAGMSLIGAASLRRAYRGTIRLYQGEPSNDQGPAVKNPVAAAAGPASKPRGLLVEARLPGLPEPVSAIALAGFRSLLRAPEAKMMLLSSLIMVVVFGSLITRGGGESPEWSRPLVGIGAMMLVLFTLSNVMANQFGLDRDGFRVFVLSSARRRDILLGKNLAVAPVVLGLAAILIAFLQLFRPMRVDHLLAMLPQLVSMFFLYCILTNLLSIFAPVHVPSGSLRPANPSISTVLLQLVTLMILLPMIQGLTLIPLGTEYLLELTGQFTGLPICLLLTVAQAALVLLVYVFSLGWQGRLLQQREQRILERVIARGA